jgi:hypothetical protein
VIVKTVIYTHIHIQTHFLDPSPCSRWHEYKNGHKRKKNKEKKRKEKII